MMAQRCRRTKDRCLAYFKRMNFMPCELYLNETVTPPKKPLTFQELTKSELILSLVSNRRTLLVSPHPVLDLLGIRRGFLSRTVIMVVLFILSCDSEHQRSPATGGEISHPQAVDPMLWGERGRGRRGGWGIADCVPEPGPRKRRGSAGMRNGPGGHLCAPRGARGLMATAACLPPSAFPSALSLRPDRGNDGLVRLEDNDWLGLWTLPVTRS